RSRPAAPRPGGGRPVARSRAAGRGSTTASPSPPRRRAPGRPPPASSRRSTPGRRPPAVLRQLTDRRELAVAVRAEPADAAGRRAHEALAQFHSGWLTI